MTNLFAFEARADRTEDAVVGYSSTQRLEGDEVRSLEELLQGKELVYRDSPPYHTPVALSQDLYSGGLQGEREEFSGSLTDYLEDDELDSVAICRTNGELYLRAEYGPESTLRFGRLAEKFPPNNWIADNFRGVLEIKIEDGAEFYDELTN